MIRRWLIRASFLAVPLLCIGLWAASYWYRIGVQHTTDGFDGACMDVEGGRWILIHPIGSEMLDVRATRNRGRWLDPFIVPYGGTWFTRWYSIAQYRFIGFAYGHGFIEWNDAQGAHEGWLVMMPMWFPTFISTLLLGIAWRRTRLPIKGRAFPVETTTQRQQINSSHSTT